MNIHPFFVHFAFSLLICYAIIEIICILFRVSSTKWTYIKKFLLHSGVGFAFISLITGGMAEMIMTKQNPDLKPLIERHEQFVSASFWLFLLAAYAYSVVGMAERGKLATPIGRKLVSIGELIMRRSVLLAISISGLIAISFGGALGGAIVHGKDADFFVRMVYNLTI